jgi:hypothetical protein
MRYTVLASDYDNTLAVEGQVDAPTLAALDRWRAAGRRLVLVTGRHLDDLLRVFPQADCFDVLVPENGALLYHTATREERLLGQQPPDELIHSLREQGVEPLYVGKGSAATLLPHEQAARDTLHRLGLPWQVILNKNDVLMLPPGVEKASGLRAALELLDAAPEHTAAIGDAQNDIHLLDVCGYGVAVADALPELRARADHVTQGGAGAGVAELIDTLLAADA